MEWYQIMTIIGTNLVVFLGIIGLMLNLYFNTDKKIEAIHQEIKDFHGRLCAIEERRNKN